MSIFKMFDKLDDIIYKPIESVCDWITEPLKGRAHKRDIETREKKSELRIKEKEAAADLKKSIKKAISEIEELRKDKEVERSIKLSEALADYQRELTQINVDAINAIGEMYLDLRQRSDTHFTESYSNYKITQDEAVKKAMDDFKNIETQFSGNERVKKLLEKAVETKMENILVTATEYIRDLRQDHNDFKKSINLLAHKGQEFIEETSRDIRKNILEGSNENKKLASKDKNFDDIEDANFTETKE